MDAVGEGGAAAGESELFEVEDVVGAPLSAHQLDLGRLLGGVGVQARARLHTFRHLTKERFRAGEREARRVGVAQATLGGTMPSRKKRVALVDRAAALLAEACRYLVARVHHALAGGGAEADARQ